MRRSTVFLALTLLNVAVLAFLLLVYPHARGDRCDAVLAEQKQLVRELRLTDLCLFTEARYTRNLSLADLHAPFQDCPMAFEHFPSGSITIPSILLRDGVK